MIQDFFANLWSVALEAAPWLLLGLVVSGLIKVWMPTKLMQRWLGGRGLRPVVNAAVLGTPLPLCSCSVVPAAVTLRRAGASKEATVSFLVATPENGADSIALTYALLGPFMAIVRPIAAIISAVLAGVLTAMSNNETQEPTVAEPAAAKQAGESKCCGGGCGTEEPKQEPTRSLIAKVGDALRYAGGDLYKDIVFWLSIGLVLSAVIQTFVPHGAMAEWGSGLLAMLAMLLVGVPMYICATASTPVAAAMLIAGVSPGTVLVFLLAGPATNLGTIGIVRRELGGRACGAYLLGACGGAVVMGLALDWIVNSYGIAVIAQAAEHADMVPYWLAIASLAVLIAMTLRVIYLWMRSGEAAADCCDDDAEAEKSCCH